MQWSRSNVSRLFEKDGAYRIGCRCGGNDWILHKWQGSPIHPCLWFWSQLNSINLYSGDSGKYFYAKGNVSRMLSSVGDFVSFQATMEQILRSINGNTECISISVKRKGKTKIRIAQQQNQSTRTVFRLWKSVPLLRLLEDAHAIASWRTATRLSNLWHEIRSGGQFSIAYANSYRRETISMRDMQ